MHTQLLIRESFSKASKNYDQLSTIQRQIADELIKKIKFLYLANKLLDIGMGTGYLLQRIRLLYPELELYGLDCAFGMLEIARKINISASYLQADAKNMPFDDGVFDIVVSNATYQWVGDLNTAFKEAKRVLSDKGKFYFTIFCEKTLRELREVVLELSQDKHIEPLGNLPNKNQIDDLLKDSGFSVIEEDTFNIRYYYRNVHELLVWLKNIGANRYWPKQMYNGLSGRAFIEAISKRYQERFNPSQESQGFNPGAECISSSAREGALTFRPRSSADKGKIFATFEVLFVEASKI